MPKPKRHGGTIAYNPALDTAWRPIHSLYAPSIFPSFVRRTCVDYSMPMPGDAADSAVDEKAHAGSITMTSDQLQHRTITIATQPLVNALTRAPRDHDAPYVTAQPLVHNIPVADDRAATTAAADGSYPLALAAPAFRQSDWCISHWQCPWFETETTVSNWTQQSRLVSLGNGNVHHLVGRDCFSGEHYLLCHFDLDLRHGTYRDLSLSTPWLHQYLILDVVAVHESCLTPWPSSSSSPSPKNGDRYLLLIYIHMFHIYDTYTNQWYASHHGVPSPALLPPSSFPAADDATEVITQMAAFFRICSVRVIDHYLLFLVYRPGITHMVTFDLHHLLTDVTFTRLVDPTSDAMMKPSPRVAPIGVGTSPRWRFLPCDMRSPRYTIAAGDEHHICANDDGACVTLDVPYQLVKTSVTIALHQFHSLNPSDDDDDKETNISMTQSTLYNQYVYYIDGMLYVIGGNILSHRGLAASFPSLTCCCIDIHAREPVWHILPSLPQRIGDAKSFSF
jgi:hypothetical protein